MNPSELEPSTPDDFVNENKIEDKVQTCEFFPPGKGLVSVPRVMVPAGRFGQEGRGRNGSIEVA